MKRILVFIMFTLLLIACEPVTEETGPSDEYRQGKDGIVVNFAAQNPPRKIYERSPLYLVVEIENKGAFDNNPTSLGHVTLHGFDATAMPFSADGQNYAEQDLPAVQGKGPFLKEGGYDTIAFEIKKDKILVPYGDKYEPTLMLSTCYNYRTLAIPTVCIIPNPSLLVKNKVCEPKTIQMKSQGAPVAVTKIEEEIMQDSVNFIVTIENVGGGTVVSMGNLDSCPFKLDKYEKINRVKVNMEMRNAKFMGCQPSNEVQLVDGKGTIFCRFALSETAPYTTPLKVQLDYAYNTNVMRTLEIVKIPGTSYKGYSDGGQSDGGGNVGAGDKSDGGGNVGAGDESDGGGNT